MDEYVKCTCCGAPVSVDDPKIKPDDIVGCKDGGLFTPCHACRFKDNPAACEEIRREDGLTLAKAKDVLW